MKKTLLYFTLFSFLIGCSSIKQRTTKQTRTALTATFYENQFTGLLVVDATSKDTLLAINSRKYFTPASTAKIFTLFTALNVLPDHIPALKYIVQNDTIFIEGTGDPTFLHSYFEHNRTLNFLKGYKNIALHLNNFEDEKYGPGWAWDDYAYYYQPEKSAFPLYGNVTTLYNSGGLSITPSYFKGAVFPIHSKQNRELRHNRFYFSPSRKDTVAIPYITDHELTRALLEAALKKKVFVAEKMPSEKKEVLYSVASDSVYRRMMHESDNFIAEQLLILSSSMLSDTLNGAIAQNHILENQLADLKQPPRWVDGSGLSRYNLFTPESIVAVLSQLYMDVSKERLFAFFPAGGQGTLKDWYKGNPKPYLFAKTGSLGNNHNISGYLITKSGKTLIFSFMNNHFKQPSSEVKKRMENIFEELRDTY